MATRARRALARLSARALGDASLARVASRSSALERVAPRSRATTRADATRARAMSSLRASARALKRDDALKRDATRDDGDATRRASAPSDAPSDATGKTSTRSDARGFDDLRARATTYAAEAAAEMRARAKASGIDVDAVDDAAREAGEAARKAGRRAAAAATGDARAGGKKSWTTPSGFAAMAIDAVKEEYRLAMMDPGDAAAERRKAAGYDEAMFEPYDGTTAVATTAATKPSAFGKLWGGVKSKLGIASAFDKLEGLKKTAPYAKGAELAEDMRERWETSDSPVVHRIQDFQDNLFSETEQGEAYRMIRQRDPMFNINDFIAEVRRDIPKVLGAYLKGDVEALKQTNISSEMLERLSGQMNLWKHEGQHVDPRILDLSEVELMEVRLMENEPLVVLTFSCQQINCVRDKSGAVVEGAEDDIQSVHYLWAMQLVDKEYTTKDGRKYTKPTWALRELVLRGMMAVAA